MHILAQHAVLQKQKHNQRLAYKQKPPFFIFLTGLDSRSLARPFSCLYPLPYWLLSFVVLIDVGRGESGATLGRPTQDNTTHTNPNNSMNMIKNTI